MNFYIHLDICVQNKTFKFSQLTIAKILGKKRYFFVCTFALEEPFLERIQTDTHKNHFFMVYTYMLAYIENIMVFMHVHMIYFTQMVPYYINCPTNCVFTQ